jgi:putative ABC transport system permease protein
VRWLTQIFVVVALNLRTVWQRRGASLAAAVGVAGTVAVMVAVLSIAEGFRGTLAETGSPDTALVLRSGNDSELGSALALETTKIIADAPGVLRGPEGPVASAELYVTVDLPKRSTGTVANVPLRGVQPAAFDLREKVRIVEGRRFRPGTNEIIVGTGAAAEFAGLDLGTTRRWGENEWTVVGLFSADGTASESELWCDAKVLQPAYRRGSIFQSVYAKLESEEAFDGFKDSLTTDPRVNVKVVRESAYFASQSETLNAVIIGLGIPLVGLMAVGAIFGAVNTMYSAVAARTREIATLRALGFGGGPVVISVLIESTALALVGGTAGALGAYLAFNGFRAATLNWQSFTQVVFAFRVTPALMISGVVLSLALGLLGGLFPAIRAARMQVATALREL